MDQIKIGKFIAAMRKEQSMTQRQLADLLNISDKTVSKWECGNGMPEVSLMLPLCAALHINVNELLSGERLAEANYQKKAEENMINLMKEKEENKKKLRLSVFIGILSTAVFIVLILLVCFYTDVMTTPIKIAIVAFACVVFGLGLYVTMSLDRATGYYECPHCKETFTPTWAAYLMSPHVPTKRYLKCPACGKRSYCRHTLIKENHQHE